MDAVHLTDPRRLFNKPVIWEGAMLMRFLWLCLSRALLSIGFVLGLAAGAHAELIVANPNFDEANPSFSTTTLTGAHLAGPSAAAHWTTFNNSQATTVTSLVPSTLPSGGSHMIHITTTGQDNGIVQVLAPPNTGPMNVTSSAYVYVLSGRVGLGTGNGGSTNDTDATSTTLNHWELLSAPNGHAPANEVVVYSYKGAADYYVGLVSVDPPLHTASTPEPGTLLSSTIGLLCSVLGFGRWRKRGRVSGMLDPSAG
jgi:hypothetical protein